MKVAGYAQRRTAALIEHQIESPTTVKTAPAEEHKQSATRKKCEPTKPNSEKRTMPTAGSHATGEDQETGIHEETGSATVAIEMLSRGHQ
jgi:hypothetical protein